MTTTLPRRKDPLENGEPDTSDKQDFLLLSVAICNGEDLGPFIRRAFAIGKPDLLLQNLRRFSRSKESEIEEVCKAHYQDFILAVDDLRSLLSDVDSLKSALSDSNSQLQSVAGPLLSSLDSYLEAQTVSNNISIALAAASSCVKLVELCARANSHLTRNNFYMALKCVESIELCRKQQLSSSIRRMLDVKIPEIRAHVEKRVNKEFGDWLVEIRAVSRNLGHLAIAQASAARQREEELRAKQREAEEQSRISLRDCVYSLQEDDEDNVEVSNSEASPLENGYGGSGGFDLTPLYKAYHIHQTLGFEERFKQYYFENRKLQLTSDFQISSMTPFLESHQTFFAQIAGFFIVENRILRTGGPLISRNNVDNLWEMAVSKMCSVLEDQFSRMQTASHLLLIKDYVSLLGVTLRRYGYSCDTLMGVLSKHRDKYHELLISDCKKHISEALAADKLEQMLMKKEYEYSMNVLSFQLQTSDIAPAFPYVAPFSSTVPDCCRIVRSFIEDSVSFLSQGGQLDYFDLVKKYLNRLLTEVLDTSLVKVVTTSVHGVSQAMHAAANMAAFDRACEFFFRHAAQLSGVPSRMAERGRKQIKLTKSKEAAEEVLSGLLKQKVDGFMTLIENVNWMAEEGAPTGNEYANEVIIYLETLASTAQQILPGEVLRRVMREVLGHMSERIVGTLCGEGVKKFSVGAVAGLDADVRMLEGFAEGMGAEMKAALAEARQLVNLLLSNHPENFLNPVIRERSYNALDYRKVVIISEKMKDPSSERMFGSFGSRAAKANPKKKSLDALIKRLKDV